MLVNKIEVKTKRTVLLTILKFENLIIYISNLRCLDGWVYLCHTLLLYVCMKSDVACVKSSYNYTYPLEEQVPFGRGEGGKSPTYNFANFPKNCMKLRTFRVTALLRIKRFTIHISTISKRHLFVHFNCMSL